MARLRPKSGIGGLALAVAVVLATAALAAVPVSAAPISTPQIEAERERARAVLGEIAAIDAQLELAVDAYNGATYRLSQIEAEIATNQRHLFIARQTYTAAQENLAARVVTLYQDGEQDIIEVLLGATNLDDLLNRLDSAERISSQDVQIAESVVRSRAAIRQRQRQLERASAEQKQLVDERAAQREAIEAQQAEREALYGSIEGEIKDLIFQEKERQRRLAEEAQRREEAQRQEQERLAAAAQAAGVDQSVVASIASPEGIGTAPPSRLGSQAVAVALQQLGKPYVWGAAGPDSFDCSGLVVYAYAKFGVSLPHHAATMYNLGVPVSWGELQPGDLVYANSLGHMGMYIGSGQYIAAPQTGDVVRIFNMTDRSDWVGFKRVG